MPFQGKTVTCWCSIQACLDDHILIQSVRLHLVFVLTGQRRLQHSVKAIVATAFTCSQPFLMISAAVSSLAPTGQ